MSQPVDQAYPNNIPRQPSSHSDNGGSFGTAFIILAIILVVSVIACVVGRLCSKRHHDSKPKQLPPHAMSSKERGGSSSSSSSRQKNHDFQPKGGPGDIEFGFNKPMTSAKVSASEGFNGFKPSPIGKVHQNPRPASETRPGSDSSVLGSEHDTKGQVRFANDRLQFKPVIRQH